MKINCAWINCKHNSFVVTEKLREFLLGNGVIEGSGICNCEKDITLSLEENEGDFLICDNYEDSCKFDNL